MATSGNTKRRRNGLALLIGLACSTQAVSSTFNISPIRADLTAARRTDVLTMMNADDRPVVVQVRVVSWSQQNGEEQLDDTRELLVTPPVLQIGANANQIVRVALRRAPDPTRELTYRVLFEEVPQPAPADFVGLQVALRLSIPVFVAPAAGKTSPDVAWEARWQADGDLEIAAINKGTAHLHVSDFEILVGGAANPLRGVTSKYVLPGSRMSWTLRAGADVDRHGAIQIHGHSDQGEFSADVANNGS